MRGPRQIKYQGRLYRRIVGARDPVDVAAEILDAGENHDALKEIHEHWLLVLRKLKQAKEHNAGIRRHGGGNVSAPEILQQEVLPTLHEHAQLLQQIHDQMLQRTTKH